MRSILLAAAFASSLGVTNPSGLLDPLWAFLSSVWSGSPTKAGCGADPNGRCLPAPKPQPPTKEGCGADPNGKPNCS